MRTRKQLRRDVSKVEHAIDSVAPGAVDQLAGKAKAAVGRGEQQLGELTGNLDLTKAGRKLQVEGAAEELIGDAKAATAEAAERIAAKLKHEPK